MQFTRDDWQLFMSLNTLPQQAGAPLHKLGPLVVKELVDNALDAGANVKISQEDGWIVITDDGPGIPGDQIERLFSINRPLTSSKMLRRPLRGALGNGLRVVCGVVYASNGAIRVETGGKAYALTMNDDGTTSSVIETSSVVTGTRVSVQLGKDVPDGAMDVTHWGAMAAAFKACTEMECKVEKTSPWWYDGDAFMAMCRAAGGQTFVGLLGYFHNIRPTMAQAIAAEFNLNNCADATKDAVPDILAKMRAISAEMKPAVLGHVGELAEYSYAKGVGKIEHGHNPPAELPYVVEVWARTLPKDQWTSDKPADQRDNLAVLVNRTPVTGEFRAYHSPSDKLVVFGAGLGHNFKVPKNVPLEIIINVTTPYMPITTSGKEPDLSRFLRPIADGITKATKKCKVAAQKARLSAGASTRKDIIVNNLRRGMREAGSNGKYRFSLRQLYYAVRPFVLPFFGELDYNYFCTVVGDQENINGKDLEGMYRSVRGVLYHPHTKQDIPLGTMNVENYERPPYTFNKILYIEKEGFFPLLKDVDWPERHDCALMTCQGFASRAARDLLDLMGDTDEDIYLFCLHDADASGTMIYQTLTEETKARGARKIHVKNLGLDVDEALEMGLQSEAFTKKRAGLLPVADYAWRHEEWLQSNRVELNAMTSEVFLDWLDAKFEEEVGKIIPPEKVLTETYATQVGKALRDALTEKILKEQDLDRQVLTALKVVPDEDVFLRDYVVEGIDEDPVRKWDKPLEIHAMTIAKEIVYGEVSE